MKTFWEKLLELIKSGRLSEPSTYAGIAALIIAAANVAGVTLVDPETGQIITPDVLQEMMAHPFLYASMTVGAIAALVAIFKKENKDGG